MEQGAFVDWSSGEPGNGLVSSASDDTLVDVADVPGAAQVTLGFDPLPTVKLMWSIFPAFPTNGCMAPASSRGAILNWSLRISDSAHSTPFLSQLLGQEQIAYLAA